MSRLNSLEFDCLEGGESTLPAFNASHRPRALISLASIPAVIATVVLLLAGIFADHQNRVVSNQALRADVTSEVNLIRAKLEGNINSNIQLVRGLVATIATEPDMGSRALPSWPTICFARRPSCATSPARPISSSR